MSRPGLCRGVLGLSWLLLFAGASAADAASFAASGPMTAANLPVGPGALAAEGRSAVQPPQSVQLGGGAMGRFAWGAAIEQPEGQAEREAGSICLSVGMFEPIGAHRAEGSEVTSCGPPPDPQPMVEILVGGRKGKWRTALAVVLPPEAKVVELRSRGRRPRRYRARLLSAEAAAPVSSTPLSYFVHGYLGRLNVQRLVAYRSDGSVVSTWFGR
jgi:hypothetical protein